MSWLRIRAVVRRHAFVLRRSPHRWFDVSVWPVVDVLLFGSIAVFVQRSNGGAGAVAFGYLLSGIILWHVVYQSQISMSVGFLEETWTRNLLNIMVSPLKEAEYVAGLALWGLLKLGVGVGLTAAIAWGVYAFDITDLGLWLLPVVAVLVLVAWAIALFVIGLILRFGPGAEALAWGVMFVAMPLSGVFYPVDALPGALRWLALALPTTHAFEVARALLDGRGLDGGALALAALGALALGLAACAFLVRMLGVFRARGYITRYS